MILTTAAIQQSLAAVTPVVHTTGVNWVSVATITGAVVILMTAILSITAKYIASKITASISRLRIEVVDKLDTRLSIVEATLQSINRKT
jgi:hypothetical protein